MVRALILLAAVAAALAIAFLVHPAWLAFGLAVGAALCIGYFGEVLSERWEDDRHGH